ncbi:MAG: PaaI family thioesterase [Oscillospiraceae bacterium]|nr:PaaI family thioesterase [Oscillospiraceae bacterium]
MTDNKALIAKLNERMCFCRTNGLVCTDLKDGYCEFEADLTDAGRNSYGIAHGSLIFALCDEAAGVAAIFSGGRDVVTQSANINYLRPVFSGKLKARANRIKEGRMSALYEIRVFDEAEKLLAQATMTFFFAGKDTITKRQAESG